jgi:hypothetical protein
VIHNLLISMGLAAPVALTVGVVALALLHSAGVLPWQEPNGDDSL